MRPLFKLGFRDWYLALSRVVEGVGTRSLALASGGMAFFATLSIFPFLAFLIAAYGYVADPTIILIHINELKNFLPPSAFDLIQGQLMKILTTGRSDHGWRGLLSVLFTLWAARAGSNALLQGLELVFSDRDRRSFLRHTLTAVALTMTLIGVVIFALLALVALPVIFKALPLGSGAETTLKLVTYAIGLGAMTLAIGLLYHYGPNRRGERLPLFSFGAMVAAILWMSASALFSYYLANFGNYDEVYGSIGAVAALMMWFFVSSFVILFGALLNREIEQVPRFWNTATNNPPVPSAQ